MVGNQFSVEGVGADAIELALLPGREVLAAQVYGRFGDAVEIKVGLTYYCGHAGQTPRCPSPADMTVLPPGLHLNLRLDASAAKNTDPVIRGSLTIGQDGAGVFDMETGQPLTALVVRPGTLEVVGVYGDVNVGTGFRVRLTQGEKTQVPVLVGLWKCDGSTGSAVLPGHYGVRVAVEPDEGLRPGYLSPELPLNITGG